MAKFDFSFVFESGINAREGAMEECYLCGDKIKLESVRVAFGAERVDGVDRTVYGDEATAICWECFESGPQVAAARMRANAVRFQQKAERTKDEDDQESFEGRAADLGVLASSLERLKNFRSFPGYGVAAKIQELYRERSTGKAKGKAA